MYTEAELRLQEVNRQLKELDIPKSVWREWGVKNNQSDDTVRRALNGKAKNLIVAEKLLTDMQSLIQHPA